MCIGGISVSRLAMGLVALIVLAPASVADDIPLSERRSGFETMGAEAQAMQSDDFANPAFLSVREGEALWSRVPAEGKPACASCHQAVETSMKGVAARYPAFDSATQHPIDLAGKIQQCQSERQSVVPAPREGRVLLALSALVALQSRGVPINPPYDTRLDAPRAQGRALFDTRLGQLDLSCRQCHTELRGKSLGGTVIPQGHPTGYPLFRLEWQAIGSLQRRIRNCMTGVRAEPFVPGAPEMIALELYLAERARGMPMDAPGVRP